MGRILVVDDSKEFLTYMSSVLKGTSHTLVTLTDPRDAVERLQRDRFDLLLTDINMPGGVSGFDLLRTIRTNGINKNIPIALLSARKERADVERGLGFGANDYIVKPLDAPLFLSKVESLLNHSDPTERFAERIVLKDATWESELQILRVSERGMTLWSDLKPPLESRIKVKSGFFELLKITTPPLRVVECQEDESQRQRYFIKVNFIGLTENELQKIRAWVNAQGAD